MPPNLVIVNGKADPAYLSRREPHALVAHVNKRTLARNGASVRVSRPLFVFIVAVTARPGTILSKGELGDLVFGDSADGGPDDLQREFDRRAFEARPALAALGYRLDTHMTRGSSVRCCLAPTPATPAELLADRAALDQPTEAA